jgi:uncharacterized membrane protein
LVVSLIGLIPTCTFIATSYSYDWWVIGMIVVGYSMLFGWIQRGEKISTSRFVAIMLILICGILPKATYFPLLFPMLLLKKEKYNNSKACRILTVVSMLFLIGTFMIPMLIGGAGGGDARGGTEVKATFVLRKDSV